MNATHDAHLKRLAAELSQRGWTATIRTGSSGRQVLHVRNPNAPGLNDDVIADEHTYRWVWGQGIGPLTEAPGVAEKIQYVLREVGS